MLKSRCKEHVQDGAKTARNSQLKQAQGSEAANGSDSEGEARDENTCRDPVKKVSSNPELAKLFVTYPIFS
jgi:hypothetical protein